MALECAAGDEVGKRLLLEKGAAAVGEELRTRAGLDEGRRQHEVSEAKGGEHDLREGADVDDSLAVVERFQRVERPAAEAVLAVVVVLEHVRAGARGPGEQRMTAGRKA